MKVILHHTPNFKALYLKAVVLGFILGFFIQIVFKQFAFGSLLVSGVIIIYSFKNSYDFAVKIAAHVGVVFLLFFSIGLLLQTFLSPNPFLAYNWVLIRNTVGLETAGIILGRAFRGIFFMPNG
jgi:hypothetical protein